MKRGTTPTHIFTLPVDTGLFSHIRIIYAQHGNPVLVKENDACQLDGNTVTVKLSQEETFRFDSGVSVEIQLRAMANDGEVMNSGIIKATVHRCLDNEVIG